jgi:hypothetical protein
MAESEKTGVLRGDDTFSWGDVRKQKNPRFPVIADRAVIYACHEFPTHDRESYGAFL